MWTAGKLTDVRVRLASPGTHGDGNGLYLVVRQGTVALNRSWLFRYAVAGRSHWTGLGGTPTSAFSAPARRPRSAVSNFMKELTRSSANATSGPR